MRHLLPAVLSPADLPLAELHAARLAGELYALGDAFCPVDLPDDRHRRAAAIAAVAPARFIADRLTAAWVWGAVADGPPRAQFCIDIRSRHRQTTTRHEVREVVIADDEVAAVGAALVTTPARTMVDLARDPLLDDVFCCTVLRALAACRPDAVDDALRRLNGRSGLSFGRRAERRLEAVRSAVADAVDVVDGLDAAHGVQHTVEVGGVAHLEHEAAEGQAVA